MGYQSELEIISSKSFYGVGFKIIQLVDELMVNDWTLGFEGQIHLLDKGADFNFVTFKNTLTSYHKIYQLISYKEQKQEFIKIDLSHEKSQKLVELTFDYQRKFIMKVVLHHEGKGLKTTNTFKELSNCLALIFAPITRWGEITTVRYITGYDYEVIHEMKGRNLIEQIKRIKMYE